jgi:hypothetical protein
VTGLRIYEKHPDTDAYRFGPSFTPHVIVTREKRFTAPELLAQYWFTQAMGGNQVFAKALWRFATAPHFDQETP